MHLPEHLVELDVGPCDTPNLQTEPVMHIKLAHGVVCLCHGSTLIELPIARLASLDCGDGIAVRAKTGTALVPRQPQGLRSLGRSVMPSETSGYLVLTYIANRIANRYLSFAGRHGTSRPLLSTYSEPQDRSGAPSES